MTVIAGLRVLAKNSDSIVNGGIVSCDPVAASDAGTDAINTIPAGSQMPDIAVSGMLPNHTDSAEICVDLAHDTTSPDVSAFTPDTVIARP